VNLMLGSIADLGVEQAKSFAVNLEGDQAQGTIMFVVSLHNHRPKREEFTLHQVYFKKEDKKSGLGVSLPKFGFGNKSGGTSGAAGGEVDEDVDVGGMKPKFGLMSGTGEMGADVEIGGKKGKKEGSSSSSSSSEGEEKKESGLKDSGMDLSASIAGVSEGGFEMKRTSVMIQAKEDPRKTVEVDAWIGEKTFWNRKKESKYIVTVSNPLVEGDKLRFQLSVENKSNIKNKFFNVWMFVQTKMGKKLKIKNGKKIKLAGTEGNAAASQDVEYKIPLEDYSESAQFFLVVQPVFRGLTHADMTMKIDVSEFIFKKT